MKKKRTSLLAVVLVLLALFFGVPGEDIEILETSPVEYRCYCSRDRVERALISLGKDELESILAEQGGCELTCQFCDTIHKFTAGELQSLIDGLGKQ